MAYDIRSGSRRKEALALCRAFATGGQKSVHEVWVTDSEQADLMDDLRLIIDEQTDRLLFVSLDTRQKIKTLGMGCGLVAPDLFLVGAK